MRILKMKKTKWLILILAALLMLGGCARTPEMVEEPSASAAVTHFTCSP